MVERLVVELDAACLRSGMVYDCIGYTFGLLCKTSVVGQSKADCCYA